MTDEDLTAGPRPAPAPWLTGLPPLVDERTVLLILGSFPGGVSLQKRQYYAHPQNHFWPILEAIWASSPRQSCVTCYEKRSKWLLDHGVGLWDVYAGCEREGSLDANIRHAQVNDLAGLAARLPQLRAIAHNGGESFRHARITRALGLPVLRLPSTSPANASWSFERKRAAWLEVLQAHGLA